MEFAATIPGTIGGAVRGNAGAWGGETRDFVKEVHCIDGQGAHRSFNSASCGFGYRTSMFKEHGGLIITEVTLVLSEGDRADSEVKVRELLRKKRERQPLDHPSAGSTFKNVEVERIDRAIYEKHDLERVRKGNIIPVAYLLERSGVRGLRIGDASVSDQHVNFLINEGDATADHMVQLISAVKQKVRTKFQGLQLELEVQLIEL